MTLNSPDGDNSTKSDNEQITEAVVNVTSATIVASPDLLASDVPAVKDKAR